MSGGYGKLYPPKKQRRKMEYQVTVVSTYWVEAETPEEAKRLVKQGKVKPEQVDVEAN